MRSAVVSQRAQFQLRGAKFWSVLHDHRPSVQPWGMELHAGLEFAAQVGQSGLAWARAPAVVQWASAEVLVVGLGEGAPRDVV